MTLKTTLVALVATAVLGLTGCDDKESAIEAVSNRGISVSGTIINIGDEAKIPNCFTPDTQVPCDYISPVNKMFLKQNVSSRKIVLSARIT